jgi:hypothetical protein
MGKARERRTVPSHPILKLGACVAVSAALGALAPLTAAAAPLPGCSALAQGLTGNSVITQTSSDNQGLPSPSASIVSATSKNAAYCNVHFQYSAKSGTADGYAAGEAQTIGISIGLPLNSTDGGTPTNPSGYSWAAVNGAWNGRVQNLGGGGNIGNLGSTTMATNAGYVGSTSDGGHNTAQNNPDGPWGVIQATHKLDLGKINDYISESQHQQYVWALKLANSYYGRSAERNYWYGCSTGGRQGVDLAGKYGEEFDGFVVGAPAAYIQEFQSATAWVSLVNRDDLTSKGQPGVTLGQLENAEHHAGAACDVEGLDVVADGVVDDPRQCTYTAAKDPSLLLAPDGSCTGSTCLSLVQAKAVDKMWDGPRNHTGAKLWHAFGRNISGIFTPIYLGTVGQVASGQLSVEQNMRWDHRDNTFSSQNLYSTRALAAANPLGEPTPIALEDEYALGDEAGNPAENGGPENLMRSANYRGIIEKVHARPHPGKILMWQGAGDSGIFWQDSLGYYRSVATLFGKGETDFDGLQSWFRYYHAPGVDHCGGGNGANPLAALAQDGEPQIFDDLVSWVEKGVEPQSAGDYTHKGILATGPAAVGTRPVCPWPTTAIYNGSGATTVASNFHCGGNLDAWPPNKDTNNVPTLCEGLHTRFHHETSAKLNYEELGISPGQCPGPPQSGDDDGGGDDDGHQD